MKKLPYTLLLLLTANMLHAQSGNETTPPEEDEKVVVGAIGGTVDVSALGGATYTIPVKVPDGINKPFHRVRQSGRQRPPGLGVEPRLRIGRHQGGADTLP